MKKDGESTSNDVQSEIVEKCRGGAFLVYGKKARTRLKTPKNNLKAPGSI